MAKNKPRQTSGISGEDARLFREAMRDIRPLEHDRVLSRPPPPRPRPRFRERDEAEVMRDLLSDAFDPADLETGEELLFVRAGIQKQLLRKLRRGRFAIGGECDLHGLTVPEARRELAEFINASRGAGRRCVRIIHGKGLGSRNRIPVLKHKVDKWLRQCDDVLAYCSARPADGGTGALYVLLRSPR